MFIHDALRFISAFLIPISQSAPQIYLSALPFAPERSLVAEKFRSRLPNTLTISDGRPSQWPMIVFVAEHHKDPVRCIVSSSDDKTLASVSENGIIYVCDSETGHCISGPFQLTNVDLSDWGTGLDACFSPDGKHILVRCRPETTLSCHAVVWDTERGEKFPIEGFDFVFIHCGHNEGRIASMHWTDEDGSLIQTVARGVQRPTRIQVQLQGVRNGTSNRLFDVADVAVAQFSPNGKYLAVGRRSKNAVELRDLEDAKITHRLLYPFGNISSLQFSSTSDYLMAVFRESPDKCLWRLDTNQMMPFDLHVGYDSPAVIHTNRVFVPRDNTVEIWEVTETGSKMIFKTEPLTISSITSICPSHDGHRLSVGSPDGTVRMRDLEDLRSNQPVTHDVTDVPLIIAFSPSGNMVATRSRRSDYVGLWNTTTRELKEPRDVEYRRGMEIAFSTDDDRMAVLTGSSVTTWDIKHPKNCLSFDPRPKGSVRNRKVAFQTRNDLVICTQLEGDDSYEISGLLQVWKLKDHSECTFSLPINIRENSSIYLAPDGLTVIFTDPVLCYSWNHDTAKFYRISFTDEAHLGHPAYSPDGKFFASRSPKDNDIRTWDIGTGQLRGKPITMSGVETIALSPALNNQSLLIAVRCRDTHTITLFNVDTGHLHAQCWDSGSFLKFIRDGTKLVSYHPIRIHDIENLATKHRNAADGYEPVPRNMRDGWMLGRDDEVLFWVPLEHRRVLCLPHVEMIWDRPTKLDLSKFRHGSKWAECIDQAWLKEVEKKEKEMGRLLE